MRVSSAGLLLVLVVLANMTAYEIGQALASGRVGDVAAAGFGAAATVVLVACMRDARRGGG